MRGSVLIVANLGGCAGPCLWSYRACKRPNSTDARAVTAVDVNLVLAIDASGSVEDARFELQKRGFAAAFRDPKVLQAIRAGDHKSIAVFMLQWTGPRSRK